MVGCDAVVLGTGYRHGLAALLEPSLAKTVLTEFTPGLTQPLPITDGRCHSTTERSLWFVGWDTTLAYGLSWGLWGWEVGERMRKQLDEIRPMTAPQPPPMPYVHKHSHHNLISRGRPDGLCCQGGTCSHCCTRGGDGGGPAGEVCCRRFWGWDWDWRGGDDAETPALTAGEMNDSDAYLFCCRHGAQR